MVVAILQARMSSSRLPGKVLKPILGRPMLDLHIERVRRASEIEKLVVATSTDPSDDVLADFASTAGIEVFRGSLTDVLDRYYHAALHFGADHVVRLTGDCPLADPEVIDALIRLHLNGGFDYTSNALEHTYPDGLDAEVVTFQALETAWREARKSAEREHATLFIYAHPDRFRIGSLTSEVDYSAQRWTVDTEADYQFVRTVYENLYPQDPAFTTVDVLDLLRRAPEIADLNVGQRRNEGLEKSLRENHIVEALGEGAGNE